MFDFVETTFDFVAKTATMSNGFIVKFRPTNSNVASTMLPFLAKMLKQRSTLLPFLVTMSNEISSFRQSQNKLNNNNSVERTKFCWTLLPKTATMWKQYSTLSTESFNL